MERVVCDILEQAVEPYNNRQNLGVLYLYNDVPTAKDSYEVNATRIDNRSPQTRRCYQKLNYIHNYSMIMDNMNYKLSDVLDSAMKDKISRVFLMSVTSDHIIQQLILSFAMGYMEAKLYHQ